MPSFMILLAFSSTRTIIHNTNTLVSTSMTSSPPSVTSTFDVQLLEASNWQARYCLLHALKPHDVYAVAQTLRRIEIERMARATASLISPFAIVGGGTAGLAIASRLAETFSVAVIEAGGFYEVENGNNSVVPWYALTTPVLSVSESYSRQPLVDWDLVSVPQTAAGNRRIHYARGKTLGGCSAINSMGYHRPTVGSFQYWADLVGDQSYTWPNVLPFFKKSTHLTLPNVQKRNVQNVTVPYDPTAFDNSLDGPIQVSWGNWIDITGTWLALAIQSIGLPLGPTGFSSGILSGFSGWVTAEIRAEDATRSSSDIYLRQAIKNTQIAVYTHTQAMKILFDQGNLRKANAVLVSTAGLEYTVSATKEIIVSTGVFHSPQLLMVSGIGPKATLDAHNIPVIADLPGVGQNLRDQIFFDVLSGVNTPTTGTLIADPTQSANILSQYLNNASGPWSSAGGFITFEKIPPAQRNFTKRTTSLLNTLPSDWPEIEYIVLAFPNVPGANASTVGAVSATIQAPFSRGNVTISSSSMSNPPVINMGWLTDPADCELLVAAFKRCRQAWASPAISSIKVGPEIALGEAVQSDADILAWIRTQVVQIWHPSSTCKMGKSLKEDGMAVVDSHARVFGVQGFRVVDLSVVPFTPPGHPSATVYMLAEKIADVIKKGG
ncbi:alcohol oxidase [Acephala macrosclerotiorum]|nr:alcohol oxidase [Acephala macrosclerotiorum]